MIDNYDSFTYNLFQYLTEGGQDVQIFRNDQVSISDIKRMNPKAIVLSPGPGNPREAGICLDAVREFYQSIPILGICLGHQVIVEAFGGKVEKGEQPMHGKVTKIVHDGEGIFEDIPSPTKVTRYHSLVALEEDLPRELHVTCRSEDGAIMGVRHARYRVEGIQFHPEAILTKNGFEMLQNFFHEKEEVLG